MLKANDKNIKENRKGQRKQGWIEPLEKIYIFCEGERTEPLYFKAFEEEIEKSPIYKNAVFIHIEGLGKETLRVVKTAEEYVVKNKIKNAHIWCVYDKDSFPDKDFNDAETAIENLNKKYKDTENHFYAGWSNECIEYWFVLHFSKYTANNPREQYIDNLNNMYKNYGLGKYQKNDSATFYNLTNLGNPKNAIKWANDQLENFKNQTPSKQAPATKVHMLVKQLAKYLPEELKEKFFGK